MKKIFTFLGACMIMCIIFAQALYAVELDQQEEANGECPGERIAALDNVSRYILLEGTGHMKAQWDVDRYSFTPAVAGMIQVDLSAPQAMTLKAGNACNTENFFRSSEKSSHQYSFHVEGNELVSLSMFDWESDNYLYNLKIEFTPDDNTLSVSVGEDVSLISGESLTLSGISNQPNVSFQWLQTGGTVNPLENDTTPTPIFTAPYTDSERTYTYQLTVENELGETDTDTIVITVLPEPPVVGLEKRPNNSDCFFPNRPGENSGNINDLRLSTVTAFPGKSFNRPVGLFQAPGNNDRWYVIQLSGEVRTFLQSGGGVSTALDLSDKTVMENEQGLLGMAFHPDFPTKPYLYLSYTDLSGNSIISRFTTSDQGKTFQKSSEKYILRAYQPYSNHNGGNIAFGLDGYLYIGFGDGGSRNDPHNHGQNRSTLLGSMLRIDVDNGDPYAIPSDNPFVGNSKASNGTCSGDCPEIFAWGLRNPWRWSFDKVTGVLWAGDVGQYDWEEINIIEKGKNYGWRCKEGTSTTSNGCSTSGFTDPVIVYPNTGYSAVTGGYVYKGNQIPALRGVYLYSDYVAGDVKGYLPDRTSKTFIHHGAYVASFAEGNDGELYIIDVQNSTIKKIIATSGADSGVQFPELLSETGCFEGLHPSDSLIPYNVNTFLWSDDLVKKRWLALQNGTTITMDEDKRQWIFPIGSVLIKEFSKTDGTKVETRFLARHNDGNWGAYTYKWNSSNTDAELVDVASSITEDIGGQIWTYPSEAQCFSCHTAAANYVLGPETVQMNMNYLYPSTNLVANQIDTYDHIGLFNPALQTYAKQLDKFPAIDDMTVSLSERARAYMHSNCAGCHMPGGGTPSSMDLRYFKPLFETQIYNKAPTHGSFGLKDAKILKPGAPESSVLLHRLNTLDEGRMPPVGTHVVDNQAVALLKEWIISLSNSKQYDFNMDATSDILWRNSDSGESLLYFMNGMTITSHSTLDSTADLSWEIKSIADFNGDGTADILWRNNNSGENKLDIMNGAAIMAQDTINTVADQNWQVKGTTDFSGDGKADILWRNKVTGMNYLYFMDGATITSHGIINTVADQNWEIAGVGDFNADGKSDILWRNKVTGMNYLYFMDGTTITSHGTINTVADQDWVIQGADDFNGDGKADILWRNKVTGMNYLYLMNGTTIESEGTINTVADANWEIKGTGDYNGDGKADILWRNSASGMNYLYTMDGTTIESEGMINTVTDMNWEIVQ